MITGGNITVLVSDLERSVRFYTETLELKLLKRYGNEWVTIDAGHGLIIGLHPGSVKYPPPGAKGGMMIGLEIDEPMEGAVARLKARGVRFTGPIVKDARAGAFANFEDPDGAPLYLWQSAWD